MVFKYLQKNKGIRVSYPSRAATMPLVFFTSPEKEWYVLSKDREIRRKGFGCSYDHLSDEPVVLLSHDADMRKIDTSIQAPEWVLGYGRSRIDVVKERCDDLEQYFESTPISINQNNTPNGLIS